VLSFSFFLYHVECFHPAPDCYRYLVQPGRNAATSTATTCIIIPAGQECSDGSCGGLFKCNEQCLNSIKNSGSCLGKISYN